MKCLTYRLLNLLSLFWLKTLVKTKCCYRLLRRAYISHYITLYYIALHTRVLTTQTRSLLASPLVSTEPLCSFALCYCVYTQYIPIVNLRTSRPIDSKHSV